MITTLEELYDHVNRFHTSGRLGAKEGKLHIYGGGRVSIPDPGRPAGRTPIEAKDLGRLELRTPGPDGTYALLADYDEKDAAAQIERWERPDTTSISSSRTQPALARTWRVRSRLYTRRTALPSSPSMAR